MANGQYVVKGRFTRPSDDLGAESTFYLGRFGQWCSVERALTFSSPLAGESALQETWSRLRNCGERSVILSVVKVPVFE